ncbi:MAG TPA: hypothetical protein VIE66_16345, partial [Methylocella sp.]
NHHTTRKTQALTPTASNTGSTALVMPGFLIHFLMIVPGCRCDLVWHCGRKGNGDGKANHANEERGY